ncbi:MAG: electron transport complex subunit E [Candidatus Omnitrophica bacterium]|nr:electron transport complex subunit E [Candidatus Omnitrophota bacterium]MBU4473537.1 electron transport complex subunit E [Candidatus Omnitrophota bacterium]MCG2706694.1 electron transport complex subunit E [Candidatus Omnitrophota bacterium]
MKRLIKEFTKGITIENPTFGLVLGLCPTLAVSTTVINALGMGIAATFVLIGSNIIISAARHFIPGRIRLPVFIVIIATFVTICELLMKAYFPALNKALGIFVPLIVVNCIILARAEAFASRNPLLPSFFDALGMGFGFTAALTIIALVREILGAGSVAGIKLIGHWEPITVMVLAPGALLTLGLLMAFTNLLKIKRSKGKHSGIERKAGGCSVWR